MATPLPLLSREVPTRVAESKIPSRIDTVFAYDPADPYAVAAKFTVGEIAVEWVFARDLLRDGLLGRVGEGDVRIESNAEVIWIALSAPEASVRLECDRHPLEWFLKAVYALVPVGSESKFNNVDRWINEILSC